MQNNYDQDEKKILIKIENLKKYFPLAKDKFFTKETLYVRANDDISINIYEGETLGLVGESGCGKSTLGRTLLQLYNQTDGRTMYYGRDIDDLAPKYVAKIFSSLPEMKSKLGIIQNKIQITHQEFGKAEEKNKYFIAMKIQRLEKEANDLFKDMVQLIGGFIVVDDLKPISEILLREYKQSVGLKKYRNKVNNKKASLEGRKSILEEKGLSPDEIKEKIKKSLFKIKEYEEKLKSYQKELEITRSEIYKLIEKYKTDPEFNRYEKFRDKGINLARLRESEIRVLRKDLQLIFQDPYSSLNPRMTVGQIISEGLLAHKFYDKADKNMQENVIQVMERCGLAPYFIHRYPHQFSGGQRQRIGIARALALNPKFVVCDEAVSALDVSIQSQIINLLLDLKEEQNLTYLFISHDLSVIKYISDRVGVMYLGNIVELSATQKLYDYPMHPYTEALLSAIPTTDVDSKKEAIILEGDIPSPINPPSGCKFHTRCKYATDICRAVIPELEEARPGHFVACHHKLNMKG
ncbi:MAG TPA: ATP-binding cassette domain-containing protein [Clostridiales bacterium]|nr:ATP-binding cassette domain-containing protein [Clostridiales bacterium]